MRLLAPLLPLVRQDPASLRPLIDGFPVADDWSRQRVIDIVESFLHGYNTMADVEQLVRALREALHSG